MLEWQACNYLGHPFYDLTTSSGFFPKNEQKLYCMLSLFFLAVLLLLFQFYLQYLNLV